MLKEYKKGQNGFIGGHTYILISKNICMKTIFISKFEFRQIDCTKVSFEPLF